MSDAFLNAGWQVRHKTIPQTMSVILTQHGPGDTYKALCGWIDTNDGQPTFRCGLFPRADLRILSEK
jgi:hypothetical protein